MKKWPYALDIAITVAFALFTFLKVNRNISGQVQLVISGMYLAYAIFRAFVYFKFAK